MKKMFLLMAVLTLLTLTVMAQSVGFEDDYYSEGGLVVASYNGTKPFFGNSVNVSAMEDSCYYLAEHGKSLGLKYVSFIGNMSSGANFMYKDIIPQGGTHDDLYNANINDTEWQKDFESLKSAAYVLPEMGYPYGISLGINDYCGNGYDRRNHLQTTFEMGDFLGNTDYSCEEYDINNFAVIITSGKTRYIIFQLEAFPRATVLEWANGVREKHLDKRAIVFTTSILDEKGELYTQHDWLTYPTDSQWKPIYLQYNTKMTTNLLHNDKPHDGVNLWNHYLSKWDNLICVVSANASVGKDIVTAKLKNANGYEVLAVVSSLEGVYGGNGNAYPLMINISADNRTIDLRYADMGKSAKYISESKKTVTLSSIAALPEPDPVTLLPKVKKQTSGSNKAYINGYAGNLFKPNDNMTRAEACTVFARLLTGSQVIPDGYTTRFTDVLPDDWYYNAIAFLDETGYFFTNNSDSYRPNDKITRAEFVELAYFTSSLDKGTGVTFKDVDKSNKYYDAIVAAAASGLVNGYGDGSFKPDNTITRAEVVTVINRLVGIVANNKTVSREQLKTVFGDITGHWGEYQILMAANDNVNSVYYHEADLTCLSEKSGNISFETDYIRVTIAKNGKVSEIRNLVTDEKINSVTAEPWFTYLLGNSGAVIQPKAAVLDGGRLKFTYKDGTVAHYIIETAKDHFTVTLDTALPTTVEGAVICNLGVTSRWALDDGSAYGISGVPMTTTVNNHYYPGGASKAVKGTVYTFLGVPTVGAKLGVAFSPMDKHREHLKSIAKKIDPNEGLVNTHGGPYSYDCADVFGDYVITYSGLTPDVAEETQRSTALSRSILYRATIS